MNPQIKPERVLRFSLTSVLAMLLLACAAPPRTTLVEPDSAAERPLDRSTVLSRAFRGTTLGQTPACVRVLSIDGGGTRGIIPALILAAIEKEAGRPIAELFDLIVGTSSGGLLALGLTMPDLNNPMKPAYSAEQLASMFERDAQIVFPPTPALFKTLRGVFGPKYSPRGLERVLQNYFGDARLEHALTNVLIPAYEIEERARFVFSSKDDNTRHFLMRDVARAATAAPTYFPPVRLQSSRPPNKKGYVSLVDGGVFANNPAPLALEEALKLPIGASQEDVLLLSVGTGDLQHPLTFDEARELGTLGWINPLLNVAFSDHGVEQALDVALAAGTYVRFQPTYRELVEVSADLDDSSATNIGALRAAAERYIRNNLDISWVVTYRLKLRRPAKCQQVDLKIAEEERAKKSLLVSLLFGEHKMPDDELSALTKLELVGDLIGFELAGTKPVITDEGRRILQAYVSRLLALGFKGPVIVEAKPGIYCVGKQRSGRLERALEDLPLEHCEFFPGPREAHYLAERRAIAVKDYLVELGLPQKGVFVSSPRTLDWFLPRYHYPKVGYAGRWNRIAQLNDRIEVILELGYTHSLPASEPQKK